MSFGYWFQPGSKYCRCVCLCVFMCVFGCCRGLSQTSICHGTIAQGSKRSAALMWREGAPLLLPLPLLDVVFGPVPSRHRLHCWGTAGGLSVCLSVGLPACTLAKRFNLTPLSISTLGAESPAAVEPRLSRRKWCKGGLNDTASCDASAPSSLPTRGQCTNARRDARRPSKACGGKKKKKKGPILTATHFISLRQEKWVLSQEPPDCDWLYFPLYGDIVGVPPRVSLRTPEIQQQWPHTERMNFVFLHWRQRSSKKP